MMRRWARAAVAALALGSAACRAQVPTTATQPAPASADARFMQAMIAHHAQALVMTRWAGSHGASQSVRTLAARIDVSQQDEIAFMQRWLRERGHTVPEPNVHEAMGHQPHDGALHPGMLGAAELAQLEAARGAEFDRLFLTFMIRHHEGAVAMVKALFASPGAAQDGHVYRFATDVEADQTAEIARMRALLGAR